MRMCAKPRCGAIIEAGKKHCPRHERQAKLAEADRTRRRIENEPWRALYDTLEWQRCKRAVRKRDGFCCRVCEAQGDPRKSGYGLQVHHQAPIATLWWRAQCDWDVFLALGTNEEHCITLCPECHEKEDRRLREEQVGFRQQARTEAETRRYAKQKPRRRRQ